MNRTILHMDLDTFFVSVERLMNNELYNKPILIGGGSDRGVVASCSYEARKFGVTSAMPMRVALNLCPDAIVLRGDMERYSYYSSMVTEIIKEDVPLYEKMSIDEFYIDLTGMDRFFGAFNFSSELSLKIQKETGLPISFGLSTSKTVAKVATGEAKPLGKKQVDKGTEKPFLAPLAIRKIPMLGEKTNQLLRSMGVKWIRTIQEMPLEVMEKVLGKSGRSIWKKANGIDNAIVEPYQERKSISAERTFEKDTIDVNRLKSVVIGMTEQLAFQLRSSSKLTACVTVKIRYSDFDTHTRQIRIPYTACDHVLIQHVKHLFDQLYQRRLLVRLVGVRFSALVRGAYQIHLFEDTEEMIQLYQAMDKMNQRYGPKTVMRAISAGKWR